MNPVDGHRDPDVDAAWRAASGEEPPSSLDTALAAAARRAVGAGPKRAPASPGWWPVAAAAVVAVVAIGIVEMTPPEQVAPGAVSAPPVQLAAPQDKLRDDRAMPAAPEPPPASQPPPRAVPTAPRAPTRTPFPASPSETPAAADAAAGAMDRAAEKPATSMSRERQSPPNAGASADQATGKPVVKEYQDELAA